MPLALVVSLVVLTAWTAWVLRSGRAGAWAKYIPVIGGLGAAGFELLGLRTEASTFDAVANASAAEKTSMLANGIGQAAAFQVAAWAFICVAALLLVILSLRQPSDPDGPSARVVREPRRDRPPDRA
jgi:hypothetical protein